MKPCADYFRVNAFTEVPFAGNPAGVVLDLEDGPSLSALPDDRLIAIAREANSISETVFVSRDDHDDAADLRMRYFTSTTEVDLCGHATISAIFALAWSGRISGTDERRGFKVRTRAGVIDVAAEFAAGSIRRADMLQPIATFAPAARSPGVSLAAEVLGLPAIAISDAVSIACANTGIWACFVPVVSEQALAVICVRREAIDRLMPGGDLCGVYAYVPPRAPQSGARGPYHIHTQGRFFCPERFGIVEDPVTGTASGALAAVLLRAGILQGDDTLFARQGVEMGRPGLVEVRRSPDGRMSVGGSCVAIFRGALVTPE